MYKGLQVVLVRKFADFVSADLAAQEDEITVEVPTLEIYHRNWNCDTKSLRYNLITQISKAFAYTREGGLSYKRTGVLIGNFEKNS